MSRSSSVFPFCVALTCMAVSVAQGQISNAAGLPAERTLNFGAGPFSLDGGLPLQLVFDGAAFPLPYATPRFVAMYDCSEVTGAVSFNSRSLTGPGHCGGETVGYLTNRSGGAVDCVWAFHKNGQWTDQGSATLRANAPTYGGESGGIWSCGTDSSQMRYACFPAGATDSTGSSCTDRVAW